MLYFKGPNGKMIKPGELCWEGFQSLLNKTIQDTVTFAKKIPGFPDLDQDDQISLIKGGCFEVCFKCQESTRIQVFKLKKLCKNLT